MTWAWTWGLAFLAGFLIRDLVGLVGWVVREVGR